jgi:uncharacterized protein YjbI with pentapeptide repeats
MNMFRADGTRAGVPHPPRLGPTDLRKLLAKRYDAEAELPADETSLGALLGAFHMERGQFLYVNNMEEYEEYKFVFLTGNYRPGEQPLYLNGFDLSATRWCGADLHGAIARGALWDEVCFDYSYETGQCIRCNCTGMNFSGWQQQGTFPRTGERMVFLQTDLMESIWNGCKVMDSLFDRCNMSGASMRGALFYRCNLRSCNLSNVNCEGTLFEDCRLPAGIVLKGATIR